MALGCGVHADSGKPIERDTPLSEDDAIGNAYGTVSDDVWEQLRGEGWSIHEEAQRL